MRYFIFEEEKKRNTNLDLKEYFALKDPACKHMFTKHF